MTKKISELPAVATPADTDQLETNQGGVSKRITRAQILSDAYRVGDTDVAVADGGTGASTAADARTNLGLVIGTDVQAPLAAYDLNGETLTIDADADTSLAAATDDILDITVGGVRIGRFRNDATIKGQFQVRSNIADALQGPAVSLHRDSASPAAADLLGEVRFDGENSADEQIAYSKIGGEIIDPTDASEDGQTNFYVYVAGVETEVATLSGAGLMLATDLAVTEGGTGASTAADARTNLGVDAAGTDNSDPVTLAGTPDYITIAGQVITRGQIDLAADVTGDLPVAEGGTGASTASGARTNLGLVIGTDILAEQTIGIADDNLLEVDGSPNSAEYARFTAAGLEGRTEAEFKADFNLEIGTDVLAFAGTGLIEQISGHIETAEDKTYVLDLKAPYAYTINSLAAKTASGTCTAKLTIEGTDVTGISALAVSSTEDFDDATAANSVSIGDTVALVISSNAAALDLQFTVKITR